MVESNDRRRFLQTVGAVGVAGLAGCVKNNSSGGGNGETTTTTSSGTTAGGTTSASEAIKLGLNFPLSGGLSTFGQEAMHGVELRVNEINANGGIDGRKIELIKKDAKDTDAAVSNVEDLASAKADAVMGSFSSSIAKAASQAAKRYNLIYWETTGFSPEISKPGYKNVYHTNARTTTYGKQGGEILKTVVAKQLGKSVSELDVAILYENGVFGTSTKDEMVAQADKYGYNVVAEEGYPPFSIQDFSSIIQKFKSANPTVVYHSGYNSDTNLFWKQARNLGFYVPAAVGNGTAYMLHSFVDAVGDQTSMGIINVDQPTYNTNQSWASGVKNVLSKYEDSYSKTPVSQLPCTTYSVTQLFEQAAKNTNSFGVDDFEQAVLGLDVEFGGTANGWGGKFDAEHHRNQRVRVAGHQWQKDTYTDDVYHPDQSDGALDIYAVYPDAAKLDMIDINNIPRPEYTK